MATKSIQVHEDVHAGMIEDARINGGLTLLSLVRVYQRAFRLLTPELSLAALRGVAVPADNVAAAIDCSPADSTNRLMRTVVELDALMDASWADGHIDPKEADAIRRVCEKAKRMTDCVAVHANRPMAAAS